MLLKWIPSDTKWLYWLVDLITIAAKIPSPTRKPTTLRVRQDSLIKWKQAAQFSVLRAAHEGGERENSEA